jgi:hypothetical protein
MEYSVYFDDDTEVPVVINACNAKEALTIARQRYALTDVSLPNVSVYGVDGRVEL